MITNFSIKLSDEERCSLANVIDCKISKRMASRKEVVNIARQHIGGLIGQETTNMPFTIAKETKNPLYIIAREDNDLLKGKCSGYIRGWNLVKRKREVTT